ncbi:MAG: archaemetzincin family Zn-dependent metalloprotease [Candidatus Thorarchaeota archaeon]
MEKVIRLLKISEVNESILEDLAKNLNLKFMEFNISIDPLIKEINLDKSFYDKLRQQYDASKILNEITSVSRREQVFRTLGIIDQDIYVEDLNFVFGLARSPKSNIPWQPIGALISILRLRETFYRRSQNEIIFQERILKEAIHELGHTFGLSHCNKICIMRFSNTLADTDNKPPSFCNSCLKDLKEFFEKLDDSF